ncbi:MAG: phosphate uptake regulator PhoU [Desulfurococcaceae archaeon]
MVERRRIQKTGSSSYIVTLPKEWVDSLGMKPGDYVTVHRHGNRLIIAPSIVEAQQLSTEVKVLSPDVSLDEVFRIVIAGYLAGYSTIKIVMPENVPGLPKLINEVKKLARSKLAGIEVIDETFNSIVFKVLLDLEELPLMKALRRVHLIVNSMLSDAVKAFKAMNADIAEAVVQRDDEVDRFHFVIARQLSIALLDFRIMESLGLTSSVEALNYRILARNMERIADHSVNIARLTYIRPAECKYCDELAGFGEKALEIFNTAMDSIYKLHRKIAEEVISINAKFLKDLRELVFDKIMVDQEVTPGERIVSIMMHDSLRRIMRYSNGIAESALNIKAAKESLIEVK